MTKALFAAAGSLALAGAATAAGHAQTPEAGAAKVLRVVLPDGSIQHVRYRGAVPPTLVVVPVRRVAPPMALIADDMFAPFSMFDQIAAAMDQQMDMMLRQAAATQSGAPASATGAPGVRLTSGGDAPPPGLVSYSFSSTTQGGVTCSRSVQMISQGAGKAPLVTEKTEGDCDAAPAAAAPQAPAAPTAPPAPAAVAPAKPVIDARDTI
ncbi:hypothetical protein [Sphingosinicella sp. BN140058]|uniref:hypothetical protein n=1 Tax=Sphingosinicella sp. BN140058 TaxID=1892855 RepID=UPI0010115205|nr:hypothetical protein [Sphingosinicella sp. BN140058]QAY75099.1 hypothetical protein ETR14_00050 [Sphingosinicella sp. BN140058]